MMMQTLNPCINSDSANAKTAQIMARYKPIAPRPQDPTLSRVLPHLQTRSTRTRKRGRTSAGPPFSSKRLRSINYLYQFPPTDHPTLHCNLDLKGKGVIDLNKPADIPEERDFLRQLQSPFSTIAVPRPVRLVNSIVTVWSVTEDHHPGRVSDNFIQELEFQAEPVIVTDSKNQVRAVSSAYKELVSQPECLWLQVLHKGLACKRICGQVVIRVTTPGESLPVLSKGFSGRARIEWERNGLKRSVEVLFNATKFGCQSKDYQFAWRFYNLEPSTSCHKF